MSRELQSFYDGHLGQIARRLIRQRVREVWPSVRGQSVLGIGYATPYLRPFQDEADRVIALMPAQQGIVHWPAGPTSLTALIDESFLAAARCVVRSRHRRP